MSHILIKENLSLQKSLECHAHYNCLFVKQVLTGRQTDGQPAICFQLQQKNATMSVRVARKTYMTVLFSQAEPPWCRA